MEVVAVAILREPLARDVGGLLTDGDELEADDGLASAAALLLLGSSSLVAAQGDAEPADGGTPRQLTAGDFDHGGTLSWMPDGSALVLSANRRDDADFEPQDSELWRVDVTTGAMTQLTDRRGPDHSPAVSSDGKRRLLPPPWSPPAG